MKKSFLWRSPKRELWGRYSLPWVLENLAGEFLPGAISVGDEGLTVVNQYSLDAVKSYYELVHRWAADGVEGGCGHSVPITDWRT